MVEKGKAKGKVMKKDRKSEKSKKSKKNGRQKIEVVVFFNRLNKSVRKKLPRNASVNTLLAMLNINPAEIVVVKNGKIVVESEKLENGDKIKIINVVSGG